MNNSHTYTHRAVADLAWCITSAPLLDMAVFQSAGSNGFHRNWFAEQGDLHQQWLRAIDSKPSALHDWLAKEKTTLLGKYFESLLAFWFTHSPHFALTAQNVRIAQGSSNEGEGDFVVRFTDESQVWHIEAACKYYLASQNASNPQLWMGPNGNDVLGDKIGKLKKQLHIFQTTSGKNWLLTHNLQDYHRGIIIKGVFFHHISVIGQTRSPKGACRQHEAGWYCKADELNLLATSAGRWLLPESRLRLAPQIAADDNDPELNTTQLIEALQTHFKGSSKARSVVQLSPLTHNAVAWSRGFVVHENWPIPAV